MIETLERDEAIPAAYPPAPSGLSAKAAALNSDMIWARIETRIAHRWTTRPVTWIVEGPGEWAPDLAPATISAVELWQDNAWAAEALDPSPLGGYRLPGCGPYRFTANVGSGTVPAEVDEAFRRLAEYMAEGKGRAGASSRSIELGGMTESYDRNPAWLARALQNSGAADLLRRYRRA